MADQNPYSFSSLLTNLKTGLLTPKKPVTPAIGGTSQAVPWQIPMAPANLSTNNGPALVVPNVDTQAAAGPTATPVQPTAPKPAVAPIVPTIKPPASPVPTTPTTTPTTGQSTATGQNQPATPAAPTVDPAVTEAEKAYAAAQQISPEELSTQKDIDNLNESLKKAYETTSGQPIAMEFITGQLKAIENRATNLAEPLERKMARLQAARQSALSASKFALERVDKKTSDAQAAAKQAQADALANKKFEEDKRQFGLDYALKQRETAVKESEAATKAGETTSAKTAGQSSALAGLGLVNELMQAGTDNLTGAGQFFPSLTSPVAYNKYEQLKAMLSLENRKQLKGSGAISDFEAKTLESASSALGRNLSNADFTKELKKIRGVFATAAGGTASVKITNPKTGESQIVDAGRNGIDSAIADGMQLEYQ